MKDRQWLKLKSPLSIQRVYRVEVNDGASQTVHDVTASNSDLQRYGSNAPPERLIELSFEFLLEREPKESILRIFRAPRDRTLFPRIPQRDS